MNAPKFLHVIAIGFALSFASCQNPLDRPYNPETQLEDLEVIIARDKADKTDMLHLRDYMIMCSITGESLEGKTYGQLIQEANDYAEQAK